MNKSQMILAAIGGTVVLGALVLGYFIWDASSVKAERAETLEDNVSAAGNLMKKLPMKPVKSELSVYEKNGAAYGEWRAEAEKIASRGDLVFEKTTPAVLKTSIVGEARKIADLPGCFNGKFVKPDFHFGFKDYITGGALPPDDAVQLKRLQREWNDVSTVLKTIAECGGADAGVVDVRMGAMKQVKVEGEGEDEAKAKKGKAKKQAKKKVKVKGEGEGGGEGEEGAEGPAVTSFTVEFMVRPSGLVKAVNAFATGTRFVVVENCTFAREKDDLAEALGGDAKKTEQSGSSRRRRRQQAQEEQKQEAKGGMVTDPATASLLKVSMAVSVYDFGSLEEDKEEKDKETL